MNRAGSTLVELLVVLVILGMVVAVSGVSLVSLKPPAEAGRLDSLRAGRSHALRSGRVVTLSVGGHTIRFLPDGQVLGGSLNRLTGEAVR